MINLYDEEVKRVGKVAYKANQAWRETARTLDLKNQKDTSTKVGEWHKRTVNEFEAAGFIVEVDVSPIYADMPPSISIVDRTEKVVFDHEKKSYEVKKSRDKGGQ